MSALAEAIARSFAIPERPPPAVSPLRALGRRRLGGLEVLAQSVGTTGCAASMVLLPTVLLHYGTPLSSALTLLGAVLMCYLIAVCIAQFTRRQAAAGGLYSFVFQGLGTRAALTSGVTLLVKYLGSASATLYSGGQALILALGAVGVEVHGVFGTLTVYLAVAAVAAAVLVRGVRFAAMVMLAVEACSLLFIVALMLFPGAGAGPPPTPGTAPHGVLHIAPAAIFALAGFESATFFGAEARRPLLTITRTVLVTPLICGGLFLFAAWAAWTGRSATVLAAATQGTASGAPGSLVLALNIGLACSWLASATASSHAASRLVYSMAVERLLPRYLAAVHPRFRTPHLALVLIVAVMAAAGTALAVGLGSSREQLVDVVRAMVVTAYVLVAVASVRFLRRIGEQTLGVALAGAVVGVAGTTLLGGLVVVQWLESDEPVAVAIVGLLAAGLWWRFVLRRRRPATLRRVGVFDAAEPVDVLPGAGVFARDANGALVLVGRPRGRPDERRVG
ncbi:MAG TPA: APC family permease [Pseudonocardia sp.]|nr:APC family permease [Pseudonocardia sp.]